MFYNDEPGGNEFAAIFDSVARDREEQAEIAETKRLLRMLDEIENSEQARAEEKQRRVEYFKVIDEDGYIREQDEHRQPQAVDRRKVHTLDDLPRDSEFEAIFGAPVVDERPVLDVRGALRLADGQKSYIAQFRDDPSYLQWNHVPFPLLAGLVLVGILCIILMGRASRRVQRVKNASMAPGLDVSAEVERAVAEQVRKCLQNRFPHAEAAQLDASHFV